MLGQCVAVCGKNQEDQPRGVHAHTTFRAEKSSKGALSVCLSALEVERGGAGGIIVHCGMKERKRCVCLLKGNQGKSKDIW